jgi:hypothetical protein
MTQNQTTTRFPLINALLTVAVATGVCTAAAWRGLPLIGAESLVDPAVMAFAVCGAFGLIALIPVAMLDRLMPAGAAYGFMIGMLLRLIGCSVVYFAMNKTGYPDNFAYCMAVAYLVLLGVEIAVIGRYIRSIQMPTTGRTSGSAEVDPC